MFAEVLRLFGLRDSSAELRHPQTLAAQHVCHPELPDAHENSSTTGKIQGPKSRDDADARLTCRSSAPAAACHAIHSGLRIPSRCMRD
jgi:hypothetical protein